MNIVYFKLIFDLFQPGLLQPIVPEIELLLRAWIFKYSVYDNKSTFGQQMLSLKYNKECFSRSKLYWYFIFTVGLRYLRERATYSFTSNIKLQNLLMRIETIHSICDILNFLRFIRSGRYPTQTDFILGLQMSADKVTREDLTDFAWTRELLWNNFIVSVVYIYWFTSFFISEVILKSVCVDKNVYYFLNQKKRIEHSINL